jgi:hypothetical protein
LMVELLPVELQMFSGSLPGEQQRAW